MPEVVSFGQRPGSASSADLPGSAVSLIVDAYERLGDRVLSRLRDLRGDVDADLAALRSEVSSLRTAVEDVADRVQLRQMRSSIDELRSDVAGLRRAVLEWPELERMGTDLSALRGAVCEMQEATLGGVAGQAIPRDLEDRLDQAGSALRAALLDALAAELEERLETLRMELGDLSSTSAAVVERLSALQDQVAVPIASLGSEIAEVRAEAVASAHESAQSLALISDRLEQLAARSATSPGEAVPQLEELREEMVALRRRIALRAGGAGAAISPEDLDAIAEAVTARLLQVIRLE